MRQFKLYYFVLSLWTVCVLQLQRTSVQTSHHWSAPWPYMTGNYRTGSALSHVSCLIVLWVLEPRYWGFGGKSTCWEDLIHHKRRIRGISQDELSGKIRAGSLAITLYLHTGRTALLQGYQFFFWTKIGLFLGNPASSHFFSLCITHVIFHSRHMPHEEILGQGDCRLVYKRMSQITLYISFLYWKTIQGENTLISQDFADCHEMYISFCISLIFSPNQQPPFYIKFHSFLRIYCAIHTIFLR